MFIYGLFSTKDNEIRYMVKKEINYGWDFFEDVYENTIRKGQTFSNEMGEEIQKELEKMYKEHEEWLKNQEQKGEENEREDINKVEC